MKNYIAIIMLSLAASLTPSFAEEDLNRRSVIEKSLADQQPLHRQVQLIIFDAFENTKSQYHPNGVEFYEKYYFDVKKFLVTLCENQFVGEKALNRIDSIISTRKEQLSSPLYRLERAKKRGDVELINKAQDHIASIEARIRGYKAFRELASTPQKVITDESIIELFKGEAHRCAEKNVHAIFGIANVRTQKTEVKSLTSSFDMKKLKLGFIEYGKERIKFAKFNISGNANEFLDLYSDMGVNSMLQNPDFRFNRHVDPGDEKVLKIWRESGENIVKAKKILHNSKNKK